MSSGPLAGLRVVELAGLGPAPFCGMILADLGADVTVVDRLTGQFGIGDRDLLKRGKKSVAINLKDRRGIEIVLDLVASSDVLIEGFRPGVSTRLGVGPAQCLGRNPQLIYASVTGWGQSGPLADRVGHDLNYIALSGVLHAIGTADDPVPPLNLVGDFGGGGMLLAVGVLAALYERNQSGQGQEIDAAMVDGSALLAASHFGYIDSGVWTAERSSNLLDGGAPFYAVYRTSDNEHMAVGALEPQFFEALVTTLGIDFDLFLQYDRESWPELRRRLRDTFGGKTRDEWEVIFDGVDACVAPVLSMTEAPGHPHNLARSTFSMSGGQIQPNPAPRFSRSTLDEPAAPPEPGEHTETVLLELGLRPDEIGMLRAAGVVA